MRVRASFFIILLLLFLTLYPATGLPAAEGPEPELSLTQNTTDVARTAPVRKVAYVQIDSTGKVTVSGKEREQPRTSSRKVTNPEVEPSEADDLTWRDVSGFSREEPESQESEVIAFFDKDNPLNEFEAGLDFSHYSYREPNFMKQKGYLYGVYGRFTHRFKENRIIKKWGDIFDPNSGFNMMRLESRFNYGTVDYQSEGTGSESGIDNYVFNVRFLLGDDLNISRTLRFTPYVGIAYRYLLDDGGGGVTTTGALGYDRESRYVYVPLGVEMTKNLDQAWTFGFRAEYDFFIDGEQESHLGDAIAGLDTVENDQNSGYGLRGSLFFKRKTEYLDFVFEPFIRYWKIDDSDISEITYQGVAVGYGLEPNNKTTEYGFRMGLIF